MNFLKTFRISIPTISASIAFLSGCAHKIQWDVRSNTPIYFADSEEKARDIAKRIARKQNSETDVCKPLNTGSMWPTIDSGCFVVKANKPFTSLAPGNIVHFKRWDDNGKPYEVVHRLIAETQYGFKSCGDALNECDPGFVHEENYAGTVIAIVRFELIPYRRPVTLEEFNHQEWVISLWEKQTGLHRSQAPIR